MYLAERSAQKMGREKDEPSNARKKSREDLIDSNWTNPFVKKGYTRELP